MVVGVDSSEASRMAGVAMEFSMRDETTSSPSSPPRMTRRFRRRLLESKTSPSTVEEIEAKLRDADLRRQCRAKHNVDKLWEEEMQLRESAAFSGNLRESESKLRGATTDYHRWRERSCRSGSSGNPDLVQAMVWDGDKGRRRGLTGLDGGREQTKMEMEMEMGMEIEFL
ncbi:hypothetical protein U1Q18_006773 [Sarracenia purpurea var. burkii]